MGKLNSSGLKPLHYILFEDAPSTFVGILGRREQDIFPASIHKTTDNKIFEGIRRGAYRIAKDKQGRIIVEAHNPEILQRFEEYYYEQRRPFEFVADDAKYENFIEAKCAQYTKDLGRIKEISLQLEGITSQLCELQKTRDINNP